MKDGTAIAGSYADWSSALKAALNANGLDIRDEYGIETFYEAQLTETLRLGGNAMWIRPAIPNTDDNVQVDMRLRAAF